MDQSPSSSGERWRLRLADGCGMDCNVLRLVRVVRPPEVPSASGISTKPAGVDGSSLTLPLLPGRSSDAGSAPAAVLTEWLRVSRDSSAVEETTEWGVISRLARPRVLVDRGAVSASGSIDFSDSALPRRRADRAERPTGSERFNTGLNGSTSVTGEGIGVPTCRSVGRRLKLRFMLDLGGVASAAIISETTRLGGGGR